MRSLLEFSGEMRSCLTLAHFIVGFLDGMGVSHLLVSLTAEFNSTIPSFDEEVRPSMAGPGLSATHHLVWRYFECDGPWGSIQWQCLGFQIVEYLIHCTLSVWSHRGNPLGLPSVVI